MIESLKLSYFRKHIDLELTFTNGFNILRGSNENGKTTCLESILYAWFGTKALRTSLDKTVTYGQPESKLKVSLVFTYDGVTYHVQRAKSGAEISYGDQTVTGQTETRKFIESLFRCSADVATTLLFADQNDIRGVLSGGPTAASGLVETLAELSVIESLVDKVQDQLPSGSLANLNAQIADLEKMEELEIPSDQELKLSDAEVAKQAAAVAALDITELREKANLAKTEIALAEQTRKQVLEVQARREVLQREASIDLVPVDAAAVADLEFQHRNAAAVLSRLNAYNTQFPKYEVSGFVREFFDEAKVAAEQDNSWLNVEIGKLNTELQVAKALRINDTICGLCKKDLSEIPEVVVANADTDVRIAALQVQVAKLKSQHDALKVKLSEFAELDRITRQVEKLAGDSFSLSDSVPPVPTWIGEVPVPFTKLPSLTEAKAALDLYNRQFARKETAQRQIKNLVVPVFEEPVSALKTLVEYETQFQALQGSEDSLKMLQIHNTLVKSEYETLLQNYNIQVAVQAANVAKAQELRALVKLMAENNELIRKLRLARPQIATKLWGTVLGAISQHFSQVRGVSSAVTRDAEGFKVDGEGVLGLSGSTKDALGLAIRLALSKVFLPNVPFIFLDEPAAACDEDRELAMLGTIAGSGFDQILMVTHSDLADSLASNLIQV